MGYSTIDGVTRKLQEGLYDEVELEELIENTDIDTRAWINGCVNRSTDFTEDDLTGADSIIRLASDCYTSCRLMSEQLEGHGIKDESLARYRCAEAREHIIMYCNNNGIIPSFITPSDDAIAATTESGASFGYAIGSDAVCIGSTNR